MITLRPYQNDAVTAVFDKLRIDDSTLLVAPVGAGKTIMQAEIIQRSIKSYSSCRFLCVVHTRELVSQNMQAMVRAWPGAPVGVNSAGLGRRDTHSQILFAGIQSIARKTSQIGHVDCMIVDECHLIPESSDTVYQKVIHQLRMINPAMKVVGLTGTPYRLKQGMLTDGDNPMFQSVAYDIEIKTLIDDGYLTRPISKATATTFDTTGVQLRGGEFVPGQLQAAVNVDSTTQSAVDEILSFGTDRRAWLVFCAGVDHAYAVRDAIRARGITCETVEGKTTKGDRDSILRRYKDGQIKCLTNVNVLSAGFDYPGIDMIALMRPTKSASLYIQQCGRALRLADGKNDALILDFAGNIRTLGPLDCVEPIRPKGKGEAPTKVCPECDEIVHLAARECTSCDYEFPAPDPEERPRHDAKADDTVGILSSEIALPTQLPVVSWKFHVHMKVSSPDSMRVAYTAGVMMHQEWVCFEHTGFAAQKAAQWWSLHGGQFPVPKTVENAISRTHELQQPKTISVKRDNKYWRITGRSFEERAA